MTLGNLPVPIQCIICQGTYFMILSIVYSQNPLDQEEIDNVQGRVVTPGNPSSLDSWNTFIRSWTKYFPLPRALLTDNDLEFAHNFTRGAEVCGIMVHITNRMSPWENGLAERHLGAVNDLLENEILVQQI